MHVHSATAAPAPGPTPTGSRPVQPANPSRPADELAISAEGEEQLSLELTPDEKREVQELRARDREVRAHEQAHKAAAGGLAVGGPTYEYATGPDERRYAVSGEVQIALREGGSPEETIALAQRARRAALAPAKPSAQDRSVAAQAAQMEARARAELRGSDEGAAGELAARARAYGETAEQGTPLGVRLGELFA